MLLAPAPAHAGKCRVCGAEASSHCGRCKEAFYCSQAHQKQDWAAHKPGCGAAKAPATARAEAAADGKAAVAARQDSATVVLPEASCMTGQTATSTRFETKDIVFCEVGLFLGPAKDGKRDYLFARSWGGVLGTEQLAAFVKRVGAGNVRGVLFRPAKSEIAASEMHKDAKDRLGIQLDLVGYEYPDYPGVSSAYAFTGTLDGKALGIHAADGITTVARSFALD
jgi:hypothetical protein